VNRLRLRHFPFGDRSSGLQRQRHGRKRSQLGSSDACVGGHVGLEVERLLRRPNCRLSILRERNEERSQTGQSDIGSRGIGRQPEDIVS